MSYYTPPKQSPNQPQLYQQQLFNPQSTASTPHPLPVQQYLMVPPPVPIKRPFTDRVKQNLLPPLAGFGMGLFVGGTVVCLHFAISQRVLFNTRTMWKAAGSSGAAFGCIFAVGTLFRPQH